MQKAQLVAELGFDPCDDPTDSEILDAVLESLRYRLEIHKTSGCRGHYTDGDEVVEAPYIWGTDGNLNPQVMSSLVEALDAWDRVSVEVSLTLQARAVSNEDVMTEARNSFLAANKEKEFEKARESWERKLRSLQAQESELKESVYAARLDKLMSEKP